MKKKIIFLPKSSTSLCKAALSMKRPPMSIASHRVAVTAFRLSTEGVDRFQGLEGAELQKQTIVTYKMIN